MPEREVLYLSSFDVSAVGISMAEVIDILERAFREQGQGRTEIPPKPSIHPGGTDNFIHAMVASIPAIGSAGVKWVSGYPGNKRKDLPYITGLVILNDPETTLPISIMDCIWIMAMRTGAVTAISARYLARPESSVVGILGCGVQGRANVEALNTLFPLKKVMAYDIDSNALNSYIKDVQERFDLEVVPVCNPREAVVGCDMVVTAGPILKKPHQTIREDWVGKGIFACLLDFDSYWHPDAMKKSDKFCTDDISQLLSYQKKGFFRETPNIYADLGELAAGKKTGRHSPDEINIIANLGLALGDIAVASLVYQRAKDKGIGKFLPL